MAVAFDAATESATFTTTSPTAFDHTPVGTPKGVVVAIAQRAASTDQITGVTYGGVAMTRSVYALDSATEPGRVYLYFLGASIPTGLQSVSITHTGTSDVKIAWAATVTCSSDTEVGIACFGDNNQTNPEVYFGKQSGLAFGVLFSGHDDVASLVPVAGLEAIFSEDFGTDTAMFLRESAEGATTRQFRITATSEDAALAALVVQESSANVRVGAAVIPNSTSQTTTSVTGLAATAGADLYCFAVSRDHTSGTALATCTDDSGAATWDLVSTDTDRQVYVWHKKAAAGDAHTIVTVAGAVGSMTSGIVQVFGAASGDPTTDLTVETNASADETHASFTPTNANSLVMFAVADYGNDTNAVTNLSAATAGTLEPEIFERLSTGGNDCRLTVTSKLVATGATGDVTWTQGDSTTKSVLFAVSPAGVGATVSPTSVTSTLAVNAAVVTAGATVSPSPVVAQWSINAPTISVAIQIAVATVTAGLEIPSVTVNEAGSGSQQSGTFTATLRLDGTLTVTTQG